MILACFIVGAVAGDGINLSTIFMLAAVVLGYFAYHIIGIDAYVEGMAARILRVVALTAIVPATVYASSGKVGIRALVVWLACVIFFLISLFRVRYLRNVHELSMRRIGYRELAYTATFVAVVVTIIVRA